MKILVEDIIKEFPRIPHEQVKSFAKQISRSKNLNNAIIPQKQFIHIQVKACIRHKMTVYDNLIYMGVKKEQARGIVSEQVDKLYKEWRGDRNL